MSDRDQLYEEAMTVERPRDAQRIMSALILEMVQTHEPHIDRDAATAFVKSNLGYLAGYHAHETRRRVETLFRCVHPLLGPALKSPPSPDECFKLGAEMGKSGRVGALWAQPTDDVPQEHRLLLENVYQFRQMLDHCYDEIEVLKRSLVKMGEPAKRIRELEEENFRMRVSLKTRNWGAER